MKYIITINDKNYEVDVDKGEARVLSISNFEPTKIAEAPVIPAAKEPETAIFAGQAITAPLPGTVVTVVKKAGDRVKVGDVLLILEAMKMENEIVASFEGTVSQILVSKGTIVKTGDQMVIIQ